MNRLVGCYIIIISLILSACNTPSYFLPAAVGNDIAYMAKPMHSDSVKAKNHISASYADLSLPYGTGELNMGFLNFHRSHTTKNLNIAYGAFGFAGKTYLDHTYNTKTTRDFKGKTFLGGGLRSSISFYDVSGSTEFRMLGWENALSFENGSYSDFRKAVKSANSVDTISSTLTTIYTTGISSEIIFHAKRNLSNQFGFRLFYGFSPGLRKSLMNDLKVREHNGAAFDFSFYFKTRNIFGVYSTGGNKGYANKLTLGYAF
ncbi:MAG: hypothetical protein V4663_12975 [Bacteroidota bacterium]